MSEAKAVHAPPVRRCVVCGAAMDYAGNRRLYCGPVCYNKGRNGTKEAVRAQAEAQQKRLARLEEALPVQPLVSVDEPPRQILNPKRGKAGEPLYVWSDGRSGKAGLK